MNLYPEHITINNRQVSVKAYIELNHTADHERSLAEFLSEWYNDKDYIEAKTSGSTGTPKIIRLKKGFTAKSALRTINFFNLKPGDRILHCLPIRYIAGKLMVVRALIGSLNLWAVPSDTDFSFLQAESFRFAALVPHQVQKILTNKSLPGNSLHNIEQLLLGGSSIPRSLEEKLQNHTTTAYSSYAMTETATHIAIRQLNGSKADPYYHCLEDITVQAADDQCLLVNMPGLPEQPLKTNDIAQLKDEKTFQIIGRADNIIISGGIKFSPEHLEKKLEPFIRIPFFISSCPHDSFGEQLVLIAEGTEKKELINELRNCCTKVLDPYEQPRKIIFIPKIPRTGNGKIIRKDKFPEST